VKLYRVIVEGRVQGVCFRHYAQQEANRLGVTGWVRNCNDGSVEALISGDQHQLDAMIAWLSHGPPSATVHSCHAEEVIQNQVPEDFRIRY